LLSWFQAAVLGVVQGLTEFLPISSSAHIRVVSELAGWEDPGAAFTAVTQLGTDAAVLLYFRRDIARIISTWTRSLWRPELRGEPDARMGWYVIVGTLPIGILGFLLRDAIEGPARNLWLIGSMLVVFGAALGVADALARNEKVLHQLTMPDAVAYGLAQSLALVPGVSRSGGTTAAGLLMGYRREAAARYSFLLAIPAVLVSGVFELRKIGDGEPVDWGPTLLATGIAFVVGLAVIVYFLRYISTHNFRPFVVYRIALGLVVLGLLAAGVIDS
jgi:undecaprenyl-diphosphatase